MLIFAGCASQPQLQTRYALDADGNIAQQQYLAPADDSNTLKVAQTIGIVALGFLGMYFIMDAAGVWDDDKPAPAAAPSNPALVPTSGSTQWETNFIQQTYVPL